MHEFLTIPAYLLIIAFTLLMKKLSLNEYYEVPIYSAVIVVVINVAAMVVEFSNLVLFGAVMGDKFFCFALSMMLWCAWPGICSYTFTAASATKTRGCR